MKNRITKIFSKKEKKLVTFVTGGDPNYEISIEILKSLSENGSEYLLRRKAIDTEFELLIKFK